MRSAWRRRTGLVTILFLLAWTIAASGSGFVPESGHGVEVGLEGRSAAAEPGEGLDRPAASETGSSTPVSRDSTEATDSGKIRGMTISTPRSGRDWGSDSIVGTIAELDSLGVNWVSIHPYARIRRDGRITWHRGRRPVTAPSWIRRPIREAHRQGLKIFIKPHLAYWGSGFEWRGDIQFDDPAAWDRFFSGYREWIVHMARFSREADGFAVGTELDRTVDHEKRWRRIIDAVRREFPGPLTYAANWTDYERVPFWDALDVVGIQAYFPLLERAGGEPGPPSQRQVDAAWREIMGRVRAFSRRTGKHVLFTELGYNRSLDAPYEPWDPRRRGRADAELAQMRCMRAGLRAVSDEPSVVGTFLWKWFPGERRPRTFAMSDPTVRRLIARHWASPARARD